MGLNPIFTAYRIDTTKIQDFVRNSFGMLCGTGSEWLIIIDDDVQKQSLPCFVTLESQILRIRRVIVDAIIILYDLVVV